MDNAIELISGILESSLRLATPLGFAALAELILERSGIRNLSLDGLMLLSALAGFIGAFFSGENLIIGFMVGMSSGILASLLFGFVVLYLKMESNVGGMLLGILYHGIALTTHRFLFKEFESPPSIKSVLSPLRIPLLSDIPIVRAIFNQPIVTLLLIFILVPLVFFLLEKTFYGLRIKAIGMDFINARHVGIPVHKYWWSLLVVHGALGGIGGALYTLCLYNMYLDGITGGAGWLAIVFVILGAWSVPRMIALLLFFTTLLSIQLRLLAMGVINIPHQLLLMTPYVFAMLAITISAVFYKRLPEPASLAKGVKEF